MSECPDSSWQQKVWDVLYNDTLYRPHCREYIFVSRVGATAPVVPRIHKQPSRLYVIPPSNLQLFHLGNQPLLSLLNRILNLLRLRSRSLAGGLLSSCLAADDLRDRRRPLLSGDALGSQILDCENCQTEVGYTREGKEFLDIPFQRRHREPLPTPWIHQRHIRSSSCPCS